MHGSPTALTPSPPTFLQVEPVGQCNLRCQMCAIQFRQDGPPYGPPAFMRYETFTGLIDGIPSARKLHLQGLGEPMMHPRFFEMVRYASDAGRTVTTNSNGTLLTPARADALVASGLREIHVSVDGARPETYERIRVRGKFERVVRGIEAIIDAKRRAGSETPRLWIVSVVMRQNLEDLPELVRLAHSWRAERHFVQHLCHDFQEGTLPERYSPMRDFVSEQTLLGEDPARVEYWFAAARAAASETGTDLRLPRTTVREHPPGTPGPERCDWPFSGSYIAYDGRVMPCCMIGTPDRLNFGSVEHTRFAELWSSERYRSFRSALASDTPPDICAACSIYQGTF